MSDWTNLFGVYLDPACNHLMMIAPEETIRKVFGLRNESWNRVINETVNEGTCTVYFNFHRKLDTDRIYVRQLPLVRL